MISKRNFCTLLTLVIMLAGPSDSVITPVLAAKPEQSSLLNFMPEAPASDIYKFGDAFFMVSQNENRAQVVKQLFSRMLSEDQIGHVKQDYPVTGKLKHKGSLPSPVMEYRKISATKYRIRLHGVVEGFPLVFNETFDHGWKAYLVPWNGGDPVQDGHRLLKEDWLKKAYEKKNGDVHWATPDEVKTYLEHGWLTHLPSIENLMTHKSSERRPVMHFVGSKQGSTIQNDNLESGPLWETWLADDAIPVCVERQNCDLLAWDSWDTAGNDGSGAITWPAVFHWQANGYANSWWIEPELIKVLSKKHNARFYKAENAVSMDIELVLEYAVQRWFDIGFLIALMTSISTLAVILYSGTRWLFKYSKIRARHVSAS